LQDFAKIYLVTGESRTIEHKVKKSDLAYFDEASNSFVEEDIEYTAYIGTAQLKRTWSRSIFDNKIEN